MNRHERRRVLLATILEEAPQFGWRTAVKRENARAASHGAPDVACLFPGGVREIIAEWSQHADEVLAESLRQHDLAELKIRERVALGVRMRIDAIAPHKEAARRAMAVLSLPGNALFGMKCLYQTVDSIWYGIGDRSTDSNYYTKRTLLAGVYMATVLFWLQDRSAGNSASWAFLERRIGEVLKIPRLRGRVSRFCCVPKAA